MLLLCIGVISSGLVIKKAEKQDFDELLDAIYGQREEDVAYEALREQLWECYNDPLALNQATREELQMLCILTNDQLDQLFQHLEKNGPLISIYEVQTIPRFDLTTIQLLTPFVKVESLPDNYHNRPLWCKGLEARNKYVLMRYERMLATKYNYQNNNKQRKAPYVGSSDKLFTRLSIKHPNGWGLGIAARKGAGEALTWDPDTQRYGLPVWRFHWLLNDKRRIKILVLGDYAVGYGQGIVLNAGFSVDKSSETIKVIRINNLGIRPHMSVTTACFRGVAATWQWKPIELTTYYSNVDLDGQVKENSSVSSFSRHSYYRTHGEIARKGKVSEQVMGSTLIYKGPARNTELGVNMLYSHYSLPISPALQRGNPLRFRGQHHANGSIFYRYLWQNFHFFGEGALSKNGGKAAIMGVVGSFSRHADATVLWRHYTQDFHSPYGKAFRENSASNSNEQGLYLGARLSPLRHLHLHTYYDYFYFPWLLGKSRAGYSWLAKASYQIAKTALVYLQHKTKTKPRKTTRVAVSTKQNYKLGWQCALSGATRLKNEIQCSRYRHLSLSTCGFAAAQDIIYSRRKFQLKGRIAWFNARHAHNKLYAHEPNMLHTGFNFHAYHGRGMHYCLLMCYRPTTRLRLELKYTLTHCKDGDEAKTGQENARFKDTMTMQAIFKF
jgi:hypothetical protein